MGIVAASGGSGKTGVYISRKNLLRLACTIAALLGYIIAAAFYPAELVGFFNASFFGIRPYHIAWLVVAALMLSALLLAPKNKIASGRVFAEHYTPVRGFSKGALRREVECYNRGAIKAGLFWISIMGIFALAYYGLKLSQFWVYGFVLFASLLDIFYISVWCPYRDWIIRNKCCNACRIYNWGWWMMFLPLLLIPSFWSQSLAALSVLIFLRWECAHHRHPERFYEISNAKLACGNCRGAAGFCRLGRRWAD
jgi:hypothetical protein